MARTADPKQFNTRTNLLHRPTESGSSSEPVPHADPGKTRPVNCVATDPDNTQSGTAGSSNATPQQDENTRNQHQQTSSEPKAPSVLQNPQNARQHQNHPKAPKTFRSMKTMLTGPSNKHNGKKTAPTSSPPSKTLRNGVSESPKNR